MNDKEIQLENKIKDLEQYLKKIKEMEVQYEYENFSQELSISNKKSKNLKSKMKNKNNPFFYYYTKSSITNKKEKIWVIDPGPVSNAHLAYCWEKVKDEIEKQEKIQDIQNKYNNLKKELKVQKSDKIIKNKQKI